MAEPKNRPRVYIAENNLFVRESLNVFLDQHLSFEVIGETDTLDGLKEALAGCEPDLLIIAWDLPGKMDGQVIRELRGRRPGIKIVAMSGKPGSEVAALRAGADAFVSKADPPECMVEALVKIVRSDPRAEE
jgi:DNA-binding NarL/FixJ family response regulator